MFSKLTIYIKAVLSDSPELKINPIHQNIVLLAVKCVACRFGIDQSPNNSTLCICNLDGGVRSEKQHAVNTGSVRRLILGVDNHTLMSNNAVQLSVVLNPVQLGVPVKRNQRVVLKYFCRELVAVACQGLGAETCGVSWKQPLNDVDNRALTFSAFAIQHDELLNFLCVAGDHTANSPFNLFPLLWRIKLVHQLIPHAVVAFLQLIGEYL